ncbi:MAG: site-2 protease family protein [Vicinamibacterales bacterium]
MSWSYRLATVRGIAVNVHATFAIIVGLVALNWGVLGVPGILFGLLQVLLLFGCVTLHELGHAVAAQHYGIPVRQIVLLPIGGVAMLGRNPRNAVQELVIAAAGPAVNVAIVLALLPVLALLGEPLTLGASFLRPGPDTTLSATGIIRSLVAVNIGLVLFNLIPAFPLDGGRILRGLLGLRLHWADATRWAAGTGQTLAIVMGFYGLWMGALNLVIIAALVFAAAGAAQQDERSHGVLALERVGDACNHHAIALHEGDRVSGVVRYLLTSYQPDFPVLRGRELVGVVVRDDVLRAAAERRGDLAVGRFMSDCPRVDASLSLAEVRSRLDDARATVAAVFDGDEFVGLVSRDDLREAELILSLTRGPGETGRIRPAA